MARKAARLNIRNGLKWRDARPRWEPSPASRAAGLRGLDLKDLEGRWLADRGMAISICDGRHAWAQAIREAAQGGAAGDDAQVKLRAALETLQAPQSDDARLRRLLLQDLVDGAQALLAGRDAAEGVQLVRAPRTMERLVDAYFDAVDAGKIKVAPATRRAYHAQKTRILGKFQGRGVAAIRRIEVKDWYHDELLHTESVSTANLAIGALAAFYNHALDLEWISPGGSPVVKLKQQKAHGRRIFWTLEEERAFVAWCDAHGFEDVADGAVTGLWTSARPIDMCAANLEDLAAEVWRFTPVKTKKSGQEAMPAILPQVRARLERRRAAAQAGQIRHLANATPFLWYAGENRRHDPKSLWRRFTDAKAAAIAADAVPQTFSVKKLQDTRDTCITRLWLAEVPISRMWSWTGHSQATVEEILREHYLVLQAEGQKELGRKLEAWAEKEALKLA